jgi:membrane protease YdiL (CAAX protease family)
MSESSDVETADRLSRRRAWLLPVLAVVFLSGQAIYALGPDDPSPSVDRLKVAAWLLWALVLLFVLATGGSVFRGKGVRTLMEDETTRAHRGRAYAVGFWLAVGTAIGIYALTAFDTVMPREAIHIIITAALAGALATFGALELRAHRDG